MVLSAKSEDMCLLQSTYKLAGEKQPQGSDISLYFNT